MSIASAGSMLVCHAWLAVVGHALSLGRMGVPGPFLGFVTNIQMKRGVTVTGALPFAICLCYMPLLYGGGRAGVTVLSNQSRRCHPG